MVALTCRLIPSLYLKFCWNADMCTEMPFSQSQLQGQVAVTGPTGPTKPEMAFKRRGLGRRRRRRLGRRVHPRSVWC